MKAKFKLSESEIAVRLIKERIQQRGGYCPCKPELIADNKCPCKEYRETGYCKCKLYVE